MSRRVRGKQAELVVTGSLFCTVREAPRTPLCDFYLAAILELLARFGVTAGGRLAGCRAIEGTRCIIMLDWSGTEEVPVPAVAA